MTNEALCAAALSAREASYAPYSGYLVGAALLAQDGNVYTGCNVENASYGGTICAERTAFLKAISEGERRFFKIAVAGGKAGEINPAFVPCGLCRQVMAEFCGDDFTVLVVTSETEYTAYQLRDLLPHGFTLHS